MHKFFLSAIALFAASVLSSAQEPTTTWPYLYPDFTEGVVYLSSGQEFKRDVNVHLGHSHLHYIEDGVIREIISEVVAVQMGGDDFIVRDGEVYKVEAKKGGALIVSRTTGDFASLSDTGGAYGASSSTSATNKVSSIVDRNTVGISHSLLLQEKCEGQLLPLKTALYVVTEDFVCPATKKALEERYPHRLEEFRAFVKRNKIRFGNVGSVSKILDFIE